MHDSISIECPHCGETFSLALDASEGSAEFTVDCEVCCRPMTVSVRVNDDGELEGVDVWWRSDYSFTKQYDRYDRRPSFSAL